MRLANSGQVITAAYSPLVRDRIRIRQRQLVAINTAELPPQIAWRWFIGEVEAVGPEGVSVRRLDQPPGSSRVVSNPETGAPVSVGREVYYGHTDDWEVADTVSGDGPASADRIAERYFPYIEAKLSE
ncbi:MAG: hypothetical protein FIB00_13295 [Chloroflexi bacterium]|nr:hypothetical protein [Chloroflexota bacterium]PWB48319.1 MAG: hypothetical protein C3F10_00980 [Dehalococcoidia bacterium]